ncbi:phosphatase PAP2 family protein [Parasalinivibrio latis]|uniref:phosphatase PAP2 family protein n=1 Tax=Parasalinivibrio latis TaxID=2952610 RepID=UPI0030E4D5F7
MEQKIFLACLLYFVAFFTFAGDPVPDSIVKPNGAACVIRDDQGRVVFVDESLTRKISLPGGYIEKNEAPQQAAAREAKEEVGIDVVVGAELSRNKFRAIFACTSKKALLVLPSAVGNPFNGEIIPSWNADHFGKEVKQVYLAPLTDAVLNHYRYSNDAPLLELWMSQTPASMIAPMDRVDGLSGPGITSQLTLMGQLQSWLNDQPAVTAVLSAANWFGEGWVAVVILIGAFLFFPSRYSFVLAFALIMTALSVTLLKMYFGIPRPFYLVPALQQASASGFSFPSGHTTQAAVLAGILLYTGRQLKQWPWVAIVVTWLVAVGLTGLARVWLGVHYPTDVLGGAVTGLIVLAVSVGAMNVSVREGRSIIETARLWFVFMLLAFVVALPLHQPLLGYIGAAIAGVYTALVGLKFRPDLRQRPVFINVFGNLLVSLAGLGVILGFAFLVIDWSGGSLTALAINLIAAWMVSVWLLLGAPFTENLLRRWLAARKEIRNS